MQVVTGSVVEEEKDENEARKSRECGPWHFLSAFSKQVCGPQKWLLAWAEGVAHPWQHSRPEEGAN